MIPEGEEDEDDDDGGIVVVAEDETSNLPSRLQPFRADDDEQPADFSLAKRPKLYFGDTADEELASNPDSNEDNDSMGTVDQQSFSVNQHSLNSSSFHSRGVRKRKSQHPTRCAVPVEVHSSSTDGDSSNDEEQRIQRRCLSDSVVAPAPMTEFQNQPEDMSMSRLEAEERKILPGSPRNLRSGFHESESRSPDAANREHETTVSINNRRDTLSSQDNTEDLQDEPRDLSSRASSIKSPKRQITPEPKIDNASSSNTTSGTTIMTTSVTMVKNSDITLSEQKDRQQSAESDETKAKEEAIAKRESAETSPQEERKAVNKVEHPEDEEDDDDEPMEEIEEEEDEEEEDADDTLRNQEGSMRDAVRRDAAGGFEVWPRLYQPYQPHDPPGDHHGQLLTWLSFIQRLTLHSGHGYGQ